MREFEDELPPERRVTVRAAVAAKLLSVSERTLWQWTRDGKVPYMKIGAAVLYDVRSLREWSEERCRGNGPAGRSAASLEDVKVDVTG